MHQIVAGFYCSEEQHAAYADDKLIYNIICIALVVAIVVVAPRVKHTWLTVLIVIFGLAFVVGLRFYLELTYIPWGC